MCKTFVNLVLLLFLFSACQKQYPSQHFDWNEFISSEGKFKISFPVTPINVTREVEIENKKIKYPKVEVSLPQIYFSASSGNVPTESINDQNQLKLYYNVLRDEAIRLSNNKSISEKLISERDIWLDGKLGREIVVSVEDQIATFQFYLVENRLFQITTRINSSLKDDVEVKKNVEKFLSSFQFIKN